MSLSSAQKKHFKTLGHGLKPVVTVAGKGLTDNHFVELDRALEDHELIKIKLVITDRDSRKACAQKICDTCNAKLVQEIGKVILIYRPAKKPKLKTSNLV